ncbi:hypothetical protein C8Q77DRAFT_1158914 [Trametes polyzona]|nr:hypothetical protein C8Q77DRAFT_1158914 [Trametes polyzona]
MRAHSPRETPSDPDASSWRGQCKPLSASLKLCVADIIAIVGVALFICYIIWGLPVTIRTIRSLRVRQCRRRRGIPIHLTDDLEKGMEEKLADASYGPKPNMDPYLSPSLRLHSFLRISGNKITRPERAYNPRQEDAEDVLQERQRLDSFKFPPDSAWAPASPPLHSSPSKASLYPLYSPPSKASFFERDPEEPSSPSTASFPSPPGLADTCNLEPWSSLPSMDRLDPLPSSPSPAHLNESPGPRFRDTSPNTMYFQDQDVHVNY